MVKYFLGHSVLRSSWDQVFAAFWQRYPNPYSKHVLTEDIVHREVTPDQKLLSRRLLTKTNRMPRWAERLFPANVAHSVYILEDSIVDPQNQTMTTFTWNINHARLMVVEERCVYCVNSDNSGWTEIHREAWVSSSLFGVSRAVQEFGLARFKSNVTKSMKGFEYILAKLQGDGTGSYREGQGPCQQGSHQEAAAAAAVRVASADPVWQHTTPPAALPLPSPCILLLKVNFQPDLLSGYWVGGGICLASTVHQTCYPYLNQACFFLHWIAEERFAQGHGQHSGKVVINTRL
uniref:PRELI domain containing 1 n=1 Tax=Myotis myotis TaxID=51298 RepID=A0A7J7XJH0_MYOMY|nr:PRELI domain containing 1 [Myotis myotis]